MKRTGDTVRFQRYAMESYVADINMEGGKTTIIFTLKEKAGALAETLKVFQVGPTSGKVSKIRLFELKIWWI